MKNKVCAMMALLTLLACSAVPAIMIATTSVVVVSPNGSGTAKVTAVNSVTVMNPEPAWHQQPITWKTALGFTACSPGALVDKTFCCITLEGNMATEVATHNFVNCNSVAARARSFGSVGGYGLLPFRGFDAFSNCGTCVIGPIIDCL